MVSNILFLKMGKQVQYVNLVKKRSLMNLDNYYEKRWRKKPKYDYLVLFVVCIIILFAPKAIRVAALYAL